MWQECSELAGDEVAADDAGCGGRQQETVAFFLLLSDKIQSYMCIEMCSQVVSYVEGGRVL